MDAAEPEDENLPDMEEDLTESGHYLFFVTKLGTVKRVNVDSIGKIRKSGLRVISLREGDELISVFHTDGTKTIILASHNGRAIRFAETEVRVMGRTAGGVRGIELPEGDRVAGAAAVTGRRASALCHGEGIWQTHKGCRLSDQASCGPWCDQS